MDQLTINKILSGEHLHQTIKHPEGEFRASCWLHGDALKPTSILAIETGSARVHFHMSADQLRALGLMLVEQAGQVDAMFKQFSFCAIDTDQETVAAAQGFGLVI